VDPDQLPPPAGLEVTRDHATDVAAADADFAELDVVDQHAADDQHADHRDHDGR
jgi:hypothetical protein